MDDVAPLAYSYPKGYARALKKAKNKSVPTFSGLHYYLLFVCKDTNKNKKRVIFSLFFYFFLIYSKQNNTKKHKEKAKKSLCFFFLNFPLLFI